VTVLALHGEVVVYIGDNVVGGGFFATEWFWLLFAFCFHFFYCSYVTANQCCASVFGSGRIRIYLQVRIRIRN
jgi:hypothetical protein